MTSLNKVTRNFMFATVGCSWRGQLWENCSFEHLLIILSSRLSLYLFSRIIFSLNQIHNWIDHQLTNAAKSILRKVSYRSCESPFLGAPSHTCRAKTCPGMQMLTHVKKRAQNFELNAHFHIDMVRLSTIIIRVASRKATQQELKFKFLTTYFFEGGGVKVEQSKHSAPPLKNCLMWCSRLRKGHPETRSDL